MFTRVRAAFYALALAVAFLFAFGRVVTLSRAAGPWYVAPGGNDGNDCLSPVNACASIDGATHKPGLVPGDLILVASGTYTGSGSSGLAVAAIGHGFSKVATLSGGWDSTFSTQSGFSILDGEGVRIGLIVGGSLAVSSPLTVTVDRFIFQNSTWGVNNGFGKLILNRSIISGNQVSGYGGGLLNFGTTILNASTIVNNSSNSTGPGISIDNGSVTLNNSTVSGNAGTGGGGAYVYSGTLALNNTTVISNTPEDLYGGVKVTARNSIIGRIGECVGSINSGGYNLIVDASTCTPIGVVGDLLNVSAGISPTLEGLPPYYPLAPGSLAINAGNPAGCFGSQSLLTTDQRGAMRPRQGRCDIGAFEFQPFLPVKLHLPAIIR